MTRLGIWLPPVGWMAVVFWLSSAQWSAENTGAVIVPLLRWLLPWVTPFQIAGLHALARKMAHLTEYAILAALWYRAFLRGTNASGRVAAWGALGIAIAWAIVDEAHQSTIATRTASAGDVGIDAVGAVLAVVAGAGDARRAVDRATVVLLWIAAVGGAAVIAINWIAGAPSGVLWVAVPAAIAVIALRRVWR